MRNALQLQTENFTKVHKRKKAWKHIVTVLVYFVVFWTTYAMILPALTWERMLICDIKEHVHDEDCYRIDEDGSKVLICELDEHIHGDSCFDAPPADEKPLDCGMIEHTHNEWCYFPDGSSRCSFPEHTHTAECVSDVSDIESEDMWMMDFQSLITGDFLSDMRQIALSQAGYCEKTTNFVVDESTLERKGYTRYGDKFGLPYADWNSCFTAFCLYYAGDQKGLIPENPVTWQSVLSSCGEVQPLPVENYFPGEVIFYDNGTGVRSAVLIDRTEDGGLRLIEGDVDGRVSENVISPSAVSYVYVPQGKLPVAEEILPEASDIPEEILLTEAPETEQLSELFKEENTGLLEEDTELLEEENTELSEAENTQHQAEPVSELRDEEMPEVSGDSEIPAEDEQAAAFYEKNMLLMAPLGAAPDDEEALLPDGEEIPPGDEEILPDGEETPDNAEDPDSEEPATAELILSLKVEGLSYRAEGFRVMLSLSDGAVFPASVGGGSTLSLLMDAEDTIVIPVPLNTTVELYEEAHPGFRVRIHDEIMGVDDYTDSFYFVMDGPKTLSVVNTVSVNELPSTGGTGRLIIYAFGAVVIAVTVLVVCILRRRERREE